MQVEHGRFEVCVPQHYLQVAHARSVVKRMGGERVPKMMRGDPLEVGLFRCRPDRSLHVAFVAAPPHRHFRAPVETCGV